MTGIYWAIALIILQAIVAAIAKKAQEKRNMQAGGGAPKTPPPAPPSTRVQQAAPRSVLRAQTPNATGGAAPRQVSVVPAGSTEGSQSAARSRAQVDAEHRARVQAQERARAEARARAQAQARAKAEAQARAQAQAQTKARAQAQAKARAQAQAQTQAQARGQTAKPSALQQATGRAHDEQRDALRSSERVQESLSKVLAAERKVADALPGHEGVHASAPKQPSVAAGIRALLSDRKRVREAFVLSEVLGNPRSMPPSELSPFGLR